MFRPFVFWILLCLLWSSAEGNAQQVGSRPFEGHASERLFSDPTLLGLSLSASIKSLKRDTNDSTYLKTQLHFKSQDAPEDSIAIRMRARGDHRRSTCYFAPLKLKFKKSDIRGTLFEGNKELKLVLPCMIDASADDYVLKEYLAYKLYEVVSPYHYKTRLVRVRFDEIKGRRERTHELLGFLVEDHGTLARRLDGKRYRGKIPPQMQDARASLQDNMFEFAIGNTDYSIRLQHNQKLYYVDGKYLSIPYDFDMCGLVNAPYATVSNTQTLDVSISEVTERAYKGFRRDSTLIQEVRRQFLDVEPAWMQCLYDLEPYFKSKTHYSKAEEYLESFFSIIADDRKFEREILRRMRE